jgi:putative membrane protein
MSSEVHGVWHSWSLNFVTLVLIVVAFVYSRGWYHLRNAEPNLLSAWRLAAFVTGVVSLWIAIGSPLSVLDHQLLTAHMVQHLLLMTVAAPLILLGAPALALLHALPPRFIRRLAAPLQSTPARALGGTVTDPVFCWLASTAVVIAWHVPALFEVGMQSASWRRAEHASFLAAGLLFWWPVVQPWPSLGKWRCWRVPLYLFLATLPCDALSAFLTFCDRVVYAHYQTANQVFTLSPLGDQQCAGALMWVCVTFAYLAPAVWITIQLLSPQGRASKVVAIRHSLTLRERPIISATLEANSAGPNGF